jgi:hypothetical protein
MTLIPTATLTKWRTLSRRNALVKLTMLCEFRDILSENLDGDRPRYPVMKLYDEASAAMFVSTETLRHDIANIRNYTESQLTAWLTDGISFDHISTANELAEIAHKTPVQLLNEAINPGNAEGKTMTVKELEAYALGEKIITPEYVQGMNWLRRLADLPARYNWVAEKTQRFTTWLEQGKEFFT